MEILTLSLAEAYFPGRHDSASERAGSGSRGKEQLHMARRAYRTISADSHTLEPQDLWERWLESKYLDTAPKLVEDKDGGHAWVYMGGNTPEPLGLVSCAGIRPEDLKWTGARYGQTTNPAAREIHPGCYLGDKRFGGMDIERLGAWRLYAPSRAMLKFM